MFAMSRKRSMKRAIVRARNQSPAHTSNGNDPVFVNALPGTTLDVSPTERRQLEHRARELGVKGGTYETWELVQFGNAIAASRDDLWMEWLARDIYPLAAATDRLRFIVGKILGQVRSHPESLRRKDDQGRWVYPFSEQDAGEIMHQYTVIALVADRLSISVDPHTEMSKDLVFALRDLLNKGEPDRLIEIANQVIPPDTVLDSWLNSIKRPGPKRQSVLDRLCIRAKPYIEAGSGFNDSLFSQMIQDLESIPLRTDAENEEFVYLSEGEPRLLKKAYQRRNRSQ